MVKIVNNNRGMALVVALLTSFLLLALVASLFWIIASTSKQSEYAKNSAIALNLAEAGTADAIYRLNYCTGTDPAADLYPFLGTYIPFDLTSSDTFPLVNLPELPPPLTSPPYAPDGIKRNLNNGYYVVGLLNDLTGPDTLVSVGVYKAVRRILTVPLRGNNDINQVRHPVTPTIPFTQGISEAFNKHVIYTNTITATGTPIVTGNIVYTGGTSPTPLGTNTKTFIDPSLFGVPAPVDISLDIANDPGTGFSTERYLLGIDQADGITTFNSRYGGGAYAGGIYNFNGDTVTNSVETDGNIIFSGTNTVSNFVRSNSGTVRLGGTMTINTNAAFFASGGITINGLTTQAAGTGVIAVRNSNLTFSGTFSSINSTGSAKKAAIMLYDTSGNNALTINAGIGPNITLKNDNSQAAIIVYSTIVITATTINDAPVISASGNQPVAIVVYSTTDNANLTINTPGDTINGLIYTGSGGINTKTATITLTSGTITGALISGGTAVPANRATGIVNLNGGTLTYNYQTGFASAVSATDIYQGFSGGRRAYVPVWQGWSLR